MKSTLENHWGRPPAVESGLGPSAGGGERPGAVRRPWRVAWGRPWNGANVNVKIVALKDNSGNLTF